MTATAKGVLIVEPDARERGRLVRGLEARGWHVLAVADGPAAVRACRERPAEVDVAIVDLQLPGLQGALTLTEIRDMNPAVARCAMSAELSPYSATVFRRMTDLTLFPKPIRVERLDAALRELVGDGPGSPALAPASPAAPDCRRDG